MDDIEFGQAKSNDEDAIVDLLQELFIHEADFRPSPPTQRKGVRMILENPDRGRFLVARRRGEIVGMLSLLSTISTAEGGEVLLLEDFIVQEGCRGRGIGSELLERAIAFGQQHGYLRITLLTERITEGRQLDFFARHGFVDSHMLPMRCLLVEHLSADT